MEHQLHHALRVSLINKTTRENLNSGSPRNARTQPSDPHTHAHARTRSNAAYLLSPALSHVYATDTPERMTFFGYRKGRK